MLEQKEFQTAFLSTLDGLEYILTGSERMKERPIKRVGRFFKKIIRIFRIYIKFSSVKIKGKNLTGGKIQIDDVLVLNLLVKLLLIVS